MPAALAKPSGLEIPPPSKEILYEGMPLSVWARRMEDRDVRTSYDAWQVMMQVGRPAIPYLMRLLDSDYDNARREAVFSLGQLNGPMPREVLVALRRVAAREQDPTARKEAVRVLNKLAGQQSSK